MDYGTLCRMASESVKNVILKAWGKSGIADGIRMGSFKFPSLDSFDELDPPRNDQEEYDLMAALSIPEDRSGKGITELS